jgi:hypothetical protein
MTKAWKLTIAEKRAITSRYIAGEKTADIAKAYGVSQGYPGTLALRYGASMRQPLKSAGLKAAKARRVA